MKTLLFFIGCVALIIAASADVAKSLTHNTKSSIGRLDNITGMNKGIDGDSSDYQTGVVTLSNARLRQPHILSIKTSGSELVGKITFNGRVIKYISGKRIYVDLSPYLSVGEHIVEISARYFPVSSSVNVEFNAPNNKLSQQTSGNGVLTYTLNLSVH